MLLASRPHGRRNRPAPPPVRPSHQRKRRALTVYEWCEICLHGDFTDNAQCAACARQALYANTIKLGFMPGFHRKEARR